MWLCQRLLEDDVDDPLQLLRVQQLDAGQLVHDHREVLGADLIQQARNLGSNAVPESLLRPPLSLLPVGWCPHATRRPGRVDMVDETSSPLGQAPPFSPKLTVVVPRVQP